MSFNSAIGLILAFVCCLSPVVEGKSLIEGFVSPEKRNYPSIWVFNIGMKSPPEVITSDLEELVKVGISSYMMIGYGAAVTKKLPYGDTSLKGKMHGLLAERIRWALKESHRLGLKVWIMLGPGGCGNSDCSPEHAQKELILTTSRTRTDADADQRVRLPKKSATETPKNQDGSPKHHWDVKTLAVPVLGAPVATEDVVDVSAFLDRVSDRLEWKPPHAGEWIVIRAAAVPKMFGFAGCFIDHMSKEAFDAHWANVVTPLMEKITPEERSVLAGVWCDSWEAGYINWTQGFDREFRLRRGYDFFKMLPAKAGVEMVSDEVSRKFLLDWDLTVGELIAENHYAYQKQIANSHGLLSSTEGCGPHLHHGDARMIQGRSDVAMGEFWMPSPHRPEDCQRFMLRDSATSAHVYGIDMVESEAFTTMKTHWEESAAMFKPCADRAFCEGLTRICHHGMLASIAPDELPGDIRRAGAYYSPKVTWWKYSAPMNLYFARCSWMLSRGRFSADCLLYAGHAIDLFLGMKRPGDGLGPGYDYDLCPTEILLRSHVENGEIVLPSGMRYKTLFLSDLNPLASRMGPGKLEPLLEPLPPVKHPLPPEAVRKIAELERDGATILRTRGDMADFLKSGVLPPDFQVVEKPLRASIDWIHRIVPEGDIYFVCNQTNVSVRFNALFRQRDVARVELWNAVDATRTMAESAQEGDRTRVSLTLPAGGSVFVVFLDKDASETIEKPATPAAVKRETVLDGPWEVSFDPEWGGPEKPVVFESLTDWTRHSDSGVRHYSGTAVYRKRFDAPGCNEASEVEIDLGDLRDIAHVRLNGKDLGIAWTPPYSVKTKGLKVTGNLLEVSLVNLWPNRLIGDAALPPEKRYTKGNENPFAADHPLLPSGLYGPVKVKIFERVCTYLR